MVDSNPTEFQPDRGRASVDDQIDAAAQVCENVLGRRGRDMAGAVGGRRNDGLAERLENVLGDRMIRYADGDRIQACGGKIGDHAVR
jgi:hypothetical protein